MRNDNSIQTFLLLFSLLKELTLAFLYRRAPRDSPLVGKVTPRINGEFQSRRINENFPFPRKSSFCWEKDARNVWGQFVQKQSAKPTSKHFQTQRAVGDQKDIDLMEEIFYQLNQITNQFSR